MSSARKPAVLVAAAFLSVTLAVAGCGGSSSSPGVAHLSSGKSLIGELRRRRLVA